MTESNDERFYIIDASIYIFKYFFTMPDRWFASNGRPTETVYGYALWLYRFLRDQKPQKIVACFDESLSSCFRNDIYPDYKKSRELPDDNLAFQLLACKKITELMGVSCYASNTHEADDLIGTFAHAAYRKNTPYAIISRDKDLSQLLYGGQGVLWDYPDAEPLSESMVKDKLGVLPSQVADFLAIVGDKIDDIPGVPGVGQKTAAALLEHFGSWSAIKEQLDILPALKIRGAKSLQQKLRDYSEQVDMSLQLTTIVTNVEKVRWRDVKWLTYCADELESFSDDLGFPRGFYQNIAKNL